MSKEMYGQDHQELLLSALISDPALFTCTQKILDPEYFNENYRGMIKLILSMSDDYKTLPSIEQIYAKTGITIKKTTEFSDQHRAFFTDEIEKFCKHKAVENAVLKGYELLTKGDNTSIEALVKDAVAVGLDTQLGIDYFKDPKERLLALKNENGTISTGYKSVDRKLYNIGRGELMVFLGPSGSGKSVTLQNLTINFALAGLNVVLITLELKEKLVALRLDSMISGYPSSRIYKNLDEVDLIVKCTKKKGTGLITIKKMPESETCARDLKAYLKEYEIQNGKAPDILVVDYLDLMRANDHRINPSDMFIKDKFICEELRALANEWDLVCASASQINRSGSEAVEFNHAMVAGGISKIYTADNVIGIHSTPQSRDRGEIEFQYLKTRNSGGVGSRTVLNYNIETLRITDLDDDYDENVQSTVDVLNNIARSPIEAETPEAVQEVEQKSISPDNQKTVNNNLLDIVKKIRN